MKKELMQIIDKWIGIPFCAILSIFHLFRNIFSPKIQKNKFQKILFIELSEMGSIILAIPALKKAGEIFPDAQLYFLTFRENKEIVSILKIIKEENIFTIHTNNLFSFIFTTIRTIYYIREENIDTVVDLELFSRFSSIINFFTKAKIKVGFHKFYMEGLYRGNFYTHKVCYNPYQHIATNFLSLIYATSMPANESPHLKRTLVEKNITLPKFHLENEEKIKIWDKLKSENANITENKKIIIFNSNASSFLPLRKWPIENYIKLGKMLLEDEEVFIVLIGGQEDIKDTSIILKELNNKNCVNLTGKTTLRELIALYNISDLLVTNDSGPAHLASLTPIKIIVFFGPETPLLYAPLSKNTIILYSNFSCSPCISAYNYKKSACNDNKCLQAISPQKVFDIILSFSKKTV